MLTLIFSILFWCTPENKEFGRAAIIFSMIGFFVDLVLTGLLAVVDLAILGINYSIYTKHHGKLF